MELPRSQLDEWCSGTVQYTCAVQMRNQATKRRRQQAQSRWTKRIWGEPVQQPDTQAVIPRKDKKEKGSV